MHVACPLWQPHGVPGLHTAARLSALKALKANGGTMPAYPGMRRRILSSGRLLDSTGSSTSSPAAGDRALRNHAYTDIYKCATSCWENGHSTLYDGCCRRSCASYTLNMLAEGSNHWAQPQILAQC